MSVFTSLPSSNPLLLSPTVTTLPLFDMFDLLTYFGFSELRDLEMALIFFTTQHPSDTNTAITIKDPTVARASIPLAIPFLSLSCAGFFVPERKNSECFNSRHFITLKDIFSRSVIKARHE